MTVKTEDTFVSPVLTFFMGKSLVPGPLSAVLLRKGLLYY